MIAPFAIVVAGSATTFSLVADPAPTDTVLEIALSPELAVGVNVTA